MMVFLAYTFVSAKKKKHGVQSVDTTQVKLLRRTKDKQRSCTQHEAESQSLIDIIYAEEDFWSCSPEFSINVCMNKTHEHMRA